MKNLLIFYLTAFAFFNQSCHKNEDAPLKEYTAENLPPLKNVRVEDNTLHFDNVQQYADTRAKLFKSTNEEIMAWQKSINFYSVERYFYEATQETCCPESYQDMELLRSKYDGKLAIDMQNNTFEPLFPSSISNWLINEKGEVWIGNMLHKFTHDRLICILDPTDSKMQVAMANINIHDEQSGIFVHPLFIEIPGMIEERACPKAVAQGGIVLVDPVAAAGGPIFDGPHKKQIKEAYMSIFDASYVAPASGGGYSYNVEYDRKIHFLHKKKNAFGGWTICERTTWTYDANATLTHNLSGLPGFPASPLSFNIVDFTTGNECEYNRYDAVINGFVSNSTQYNSRAVTVNSMCLSVTANGSGISGSSCICL